VKVAPASVGCPNNETVVKEQVSFAGKAFMVSVGKLPEEVTEILAEFVQPVIASAVVIV
jgi:hypothetical protein